MTTRYAVAFDADSPARIIAARTWERAVFEAAAIEGRARPWTPGAAALAYASDGKHLARFEVYARAPFTLEPNLSVDGDPGPIPCDVARLLLATWSDAP